MSSNVQEITNSVLNDGDLMSRLEKSESSQDVSDLLAEKGIRRIERRRTRERCWWF